MKTNIQIFLTLLGHGDGDRNKERVYGTKWNKVTIVKYLGLYVILHGN